MSTPPDRPSHDPAQRPRVLIAGGGVAAVEALLALRVLAEDRVDIDLLSPATQFTFPAYSVGAPWFMGRTPRHDLAAIAAEHGATLRHGALAAVDQDARHVRTDAGDALPYDFLVIAAGARPRAAAEGVFKFSGRREDQVRMNALIRRIRAGSVRSLAFAMPGEDVWPLPLYELALMTSAYALEDAIKDVSFTLVTVEKAPLDVFGPEASAKVAALLREREISVLLDSETARIEGGVVRTTRGVSIPADATVAVPVIRPRAFRGVPIDEEGFVVVDDYARVAVEGNVFAAGDCTSLRLKQGGLAAQQADTAAEGIAAILGMPVTPRPFRQELHAVLFTGEASLRLGDDDEGEPPEKIHARYLTPYLRAATPSLPTLAG